MAKTWTDVRRLAKALPGAEESTSYGTPAFKVKKKLMVRLHQSGEALVVMISMSDRELRMKVDPETFFITDHYLNYPAMLVRMATVQEDDLRELLEEAWRRVAPASLIKPNQSP
jgi:hypothetical protein